MKERSICVNCTKKKYRETMVEVNYDIAGNSNYTCSWVCGDCVTDYFDRRIEHYERLARFAGYAKKSAESELNIVSESHGHDSGTLLRQFG